MGVSISALATALAVLQPRGAAAQAAQTTTATYDQTFLPRDTYGEVGILDMPTSRMAPDGELSFNAAFLGDNQRYALSFQLLPWLQSTFRYARLQIPIHKGGYYDRSFGLKIRLSQEGEYVPEISMGVRDIVGTGVYSGEYFVASKQIGPVDITGGLGWGRLASNGTFPNPFGLIFSSFKNRPAFSQPGGVDIGELFHGPKMGVFGGIVWQTPIENLDVLAEYSSDHYTEETATGKFKVRWPMNFGVSYEVLNGISVSAAYMYGSTYGLVLSLQADPTKPISAVHVGDAPLPAISRTDKQQQRAVQSLVGWNVVAARINAGKPWVNIDAPRGNALSELSDELTADNYGVHDYEIDGKTLVVNVERDGAAIDCASYARYAVLHRLGVTAVAVANFASSDGSVVMCQVPPEGYAALSNPGTLPSWNDFQGDRTAAAASTPNATPIDTVGVLAKPIGAATEANIRKAGESQSLHIEAVGGDGSEIWVYFENDHYFMEAEAIGRLVRILMADAPPDVEVFHIVSVAHGVPLREVLITRSGLERATFASSDGAAMSDAIDVKAAPLHSPYLEGAAGNYPHFSYSISPETRQDLFDPNSPVEGQLLVAGSGAVDLFPGFTVSGTYDLNIINNFTTTRPSNSQLPHVRSDIELYYKHGISGISNIMASYQFRLAPDVYAQAEGGYLEDMFGGVGGQIVWRPDNSRFVIGADLYQVWQRDYDRLFGFLPYHVLTGHVTVYYASPWYGLNFNVHAGRYLAGDYGATLEITRRFDTGVEIGAFATFTNVPFSKFGEGSFDKGLIIRIPLEWALPVYTQSAYDILLRPLSRDGGQRLDNDDSLYEETRRTGYGEIAEHLNDIPNP